MIHEIDIDFWTRTAGVVWVILVGLVTLLLSALALLLPLFVWRILHWSRLSAQELSHLNTRIEHLLTRLAGRGGESDEFIFTGAKEEKRERKENVSRRERARRKAIAFRSSPRTPRPPR